jgi:long-chain acyl-CoA synthetase
MHLDLELYRRDIFTADNVRLSVIDIDPGHAQGTLVCVHGFGGRAAQWTQQIPFFADEYRIIAPDLRGHGRSERPAGAYTMEVLLRDLDDVLHATRVLSTDERVKPFVVLAHSFGGAIAATYAARHAERIEKLVLIGTASEFKLSMPLWFAFHLPISITQPLMTRFFPAVYAPARVLKPMYEQALSRWNGESLKQIRVPTLVIRGHRDFVFPQAAYGAVAQLVPNAQEVIIPVSAHLVQLERGDAVNRAIQRFLGPTATTWRREREAATAQLVRERPWLNSYEPNVPYHIILPSQPLHSFVASAAQRFAQRPATMFYGATLTWRELYTLAQKFAQALIRLGVQQGDRVILNLPNTPQMVFCYYGVLLAGAIAVPYNPLATETEIAKVMVECGAKVIVALSKFYNTVAAAALKANVPHIVVTNLKEYLPPLKRLAFTWTREKSEGHYLDPQLLRVEANTHWLQALLRDGGAPARQGQPQGLPLPDVTPEDVALIQYTTGTTDAAKGVALTHRNLVANAVQTRYWYTDAQDGRERVLCALPFTHLYGMTTGLNLSSFLGAAMILLPTFATREVLETIRDARPTIFPGVPDMYVAINNFPNVRSYKLSSVRACLSGSASLPIEIAEAFMKLTKGRLVEGYGLTEAGPVTHANPLGGKVKVGSIGIPLPATEARIVDLHDGHVLPSGEIGELCVRGPQIMQGYWNDEAATRRAIDADGWLHTGDVARMDDDGYFQIIDRRANIWYPQQATFSNRPIYPRDIEEVLYEHPKVREVVVVPIGDEPKAFVILKEGERAAPDELIEFCRQRLDDYLVPRGIEFTHDLPRTYIGKVKRWQLVKDYLTQKEERA